MSGISISLQRFIHVPLFSKDRVVLIENKNKIISKWRKTHLSSQKKQAKIRTCSNISRNLRKCFSSVWKVVKGQLNVDIAVYIKHGNGYCFFDTNTEQIWRGDEILRPARDYFQVQVNFQISI